jgi:hypothetical protein
LSVGSSLAAVWKTVTQTATISLAAVWNRCYWWNEKQILSQFCSGLKPPLIMTKKNFKKNYFIYILLIVSTVLFIIVQT